MAAAASPQCASSGLARAWRAGCRALCAAGRAPLVRPGHRSLAANICRRGRHKPGDRAHRLVRYLRDLAGVVAGHLMVLAVLSPCYVAPAAPLQRSAIAVLL